MSHTPHTPGRRSSRAHAGAQVRPVDHEAIRHLRLVGMDPEDARLDAEREHDERLDRMNDMASPADVRWWMPDIGDAA